MALSSFMRAATSSRPRYQRAYGPGASNVTVPGAPTIGTAVRGNGQATVPFTPPVDNGGAEITSYTATSTPGGFTATGGASPLVVTGLSNGTSYTFTVVATNSRGNGAPSSASNAVTPATVPGAPTIGTAVRGNTQATVPFTAPASNGGSAITGYTATSSPGGLTATGASSPLVVNGLTNGQAYTFTVVATNAVGSGAASAASNSVTPATVPGAPTIGTATIASPTSVSVTFTAPASNGGAAITGYTVTSSPGGITATGSSSPIVVTGLTTGVAYTFTVTATNAVGTGAASAASNSVTPAVVHLFSDAFGRPDDTALDDTNWDVTIAGGAWVITSGTAKATSASSGGWARYVGGLVDSANQYAEVDIASGLPGNIMGLLARFTNTSNFYTGRASRAGADTYELYKRVSNTYTLLGSLAESFPSLPFRLRLQVTGTSIQFQLFSGGSWVTKVSATDAALASGQVGMYTQLVGSGDQRFDNFGAGNT